MNYQPPLGAKDLLPIDVVQRHWIETQLQEVFQQWGYQWIMTSTLERLETLVAGAGDPAALARAQDQQDIVAQTFLRAVEKRPRQVGRAPFSRTGILIKDPKRIPVLGLDVFARQSLDPD